MTAFKGINIHLVCLCDQGSEHVEHERLDLPRVFVVDDFEHEFEELAKNVAGILQKQRFLYSIWMGINVSYPCEKSNPCLQVEAHVERLHESQILQQVKVAFERRVLGIAE